MKSAFVAMTALTFGAFGAASMALAHPPVVEAAVQRHRLDMPLTQGWRFKLDDSISGAQTPGYADADWETVSVPHTWTRAGYYLDAQSGHVNRPGNLNLTQGVGWYRLTFTPPVSFDGKQAWLQFDAASRMASVWLNGVYLGEHRGGFSRFRLEATKALKPGQPNLLVVRADNTKPAPGKATADILPLAGDFVVHGGLYRPVSLIGTDPVHIDMMDMGGPGVYATTTSIVDLAAQIAVRSKLRNSASKRAKVTVTTRLLTAEGRPAAQAISAAVLTSGATVEVAQSLSLENARLWQGVKSPYLYRLVTEVRDGKGRLLDSLEQAFGVRQFRIDADKGFFLNGEPLRLHGVGLHQDSEGKGWALGADDIAADAAMIGDMGANTIRLSHYQHGQPIHDLADRSGMMLWDEIPWVSVWTLSPDQVDASPGLVANARQQLQELIRQNYHHPSVISWGLANEIDLRGPRRRRNRAARP
jgi:beta-galactosidase